MPTMRLADLHIGVGNASLAHQLGAYYLDLRPAAALVESGYHGSLDEKGVPLTRYGQEHHYNAATIAQYALALHHKIAAGEKNLESKLARQLDRIVAEVEREGPWRGFFVCEWDSLKYAQLRAPWVSALSQGNAISSLLRGYQFFGDGRLLEVAQMSFEALDRGLDRGGARIVDRCGHLWFEEYPSDPPMHVLNGFIFALWGVLDYARATGDRRAWEWWEAGVETLKAHIADFDCGYWSLYDLRYRELVSLYYQQNVHVPQLDVMYHLTGDPLFKRYADRWLRFGNSFWRRGVWWTALRVKARIRRLGSERLGNQTR